MRPLDQDTRVYMLQEELARRWKVSPRTIERWRFEGRPPPYYRIHGRVLYRREDIEAFEAGCEIDLGR